MIYLDTSVVLAHLFAEDPSPPDSLWTETLASSRLLEYETWNRIHAHGLGESHGEAVRSVLQQLTFVELLRPILARATEPFPAPIRTLDSLHLASMEFLRTLGQPVRLASYDKTLLAVADRMGFPLVDL